CAAGAPDDGCYHRYLLPETSHWPGHMAIDGQGFVWYTAAFGNRIGRLDPETGEVLEFPLPAPLGQSALVQEFGAGPWQLAIAPNGDIYFNEFFDATLSRFDGAWATDPA